MDMTTAGGSLPARLVRLVRRCADRCAAAWRAVVWYAREVSGEARYDHYLEHFAAEHSDGTPLTEIEYLRRREEYDRTHPNTGCCC